MNDRQKQLLEDNLELVKVIAEKYEGRGVPLLVLVQEGNLGLIKAVEKYDPASELEFTPYASFWIRQAINAVFRGKEY